MAGGGRQRPTRPFAARRGGTRRQEDRRRRRVSAGKEAGVPLKRRPMRTSAGSSSPAARGGEQEHLAGRGMGIAESAGG
jgi:hypothetical protein